MGRLNGNPEKRMANVGAWAAASLYNANQTMIIVQRLIDIQQKASNR